MKIGIITFHASFNYGSMLQAWALQTYLKELGHQVEIVNYRSAIQRKIYYRPFEWDNRYSMLSSLKRLLFYPASICPLKRKWERFDDFLNTQLNITEEYRSEQALGDAHLDYDLLICGSDQIWGTAPDATTAYYGNFADGKTRKISYAASFGQQPEQVDVERVRKNLRGFAAISVREERSRLFLQKHHLAEDVAVACDPTLLLDAEEYGTLMSSTPLIEDSYIFFYTPVGLPIEYFEIAERLARETGLPVITERAYYPKDLRRFSHIRNHIVTGPCEFLNLIKHARYVLGGSFHLQVFSILFEKDFYCINGDRDSRTNNLLAALGLQQRIVSLSHASKALDSEPIDWQRVKYAMKTMRESSTDFLNRYTK